MGCLVFVGYVLACVALVFLPAQAKLGVGVLAFAAIYAVIHRHGRIAAPGVRGIVLPKAEGAAAIGAIRTRAKVPVVPITRSR